MYHTVLTRARNEDASDLAEIVAQLRRWHADTQAQSVSGCRALARIQAAIASIRAAIEAGTQTGDADEANTSCHWAVATIWQRLGQLVGQVQFQDVTRRRLDRSLSHLDRAAHLLSSGRFGEDGFTLSDRSQRERAFALIARLERAQLMELEQVDRQRIEALGRSFAEIREQAALALSGQFGGLSGDGRIGVAAGLADDLDQLDRLLLTGREGSAWIGQVVDLLGFVQAGDHAVPEEARHLSPLLDEIAGDYTSERERETFRSALGPWLTEAGEDAPILNRSDRADLVLVELF